MQQGFPAEPLQNQSTIPSYNRFRWLHLIYGRPYQFHSPYSLETNIQTLRQLIALPPSKKSLIHSAISYQGTIHQETQIGFATVSRQTRTSMGHQSTTSCANIWIEIIDQIVQITIEPKPLIAHQIAFILPLILNILLIPFLLDTLDTPEKIVFLCGFWLCIVLTLRIMYQFGHLKRNLRIILGDPTINTRG